MSGSADLPPVQDYPGWFPSKAGFWTRSKVGTAGAVGGLLLGLVLGAGGSSGAATAEREPAKAVTVTATPTPDSSAADDLATAQAAADEADQAVSDLRVRQSAQLAKVRTAGQQRLKAAARAAKAAQRRAVAAAVQRAVTRERRAADDRVAAAKAAARSFSSAPSGGGSGGTDPRFTYCYEANDAGYGPYYRGQDPEYNWYRDGDGDGEVCE